MAAQENTNGAVQNEGKRKRKAQGPRQEKPIFLVIEYTNEEGEVVALDASRLKITGSKDPAKLLSLVTGANASQGKLVMPLQMEKEAPRPAPAAA